MRTMKNTAEPRGKLLIALYKSYYNIPVDAHLTEEMILKHWKLEQDLRKAILESSPEKRGEVTERYYTQLYSELDWLNSLVGTNASYKPSQLYKNWSSIIGNPPQNIYEIGSGKGALITYLASLGFKCKGSEITSERGKKYSSQGANLSWGITDGVHLERFEPANHYDTVVSDQVVEHLHPDDLAGHMKGVLKILAPGGKYVLCTPHKSYGPLDITKVFRYNEPLGTHLKEYQYRELRDAMVQAGFTRVGAVRYLPPRIARLTRIWFRPRVSNLHTKWVIAAEKMVRSIPPRMTGREAIIASLLIFPSLFIVGYKK